MDEILSTISIILILLVMLFVILHICFNDDED